MRILVTGGAGAGAQVLLQACLDAGVGPVVHAPNSPYCAAKAAGDVIAGAVTGGVR